MTHTKSKTRYLALILAALMLIGLFPTSAFAASIADGSTSVTVSLGNRQYTVTICVMAFDLMSSDLKHSLTVVTLISLYSSAFYR